MIRLLIALMLLTGPAFAVECTQANGIYTDDRGFTLSFETRGTVTAPYVMRLENTTTGDRLIGDIIYGNGLGVPYARFAKSCKVETYGLECEEAIYEGVAYTIGNYDATAAIPDINEPAAKVILFPQSVLGYYQAIKSGDLQKMPSEIFELTACK
ncbi:hypothetical protein [Cohaesibacter celericrescens]|uniref:Uncharacterized protein n=1 Tax=Cohaesibacter celericrescens TaxID=2067669 RepID=A0A2N5XMI8_9HYPH|nr:hypothetical protein [Cohaesibacter celericrescens]PLW75637.1 hypothetical protein C0081_18480 [Cohaesibacter celericrescens]